MTAQKCLQAGLVTLCLISSTVWGQQSPPSKHGMPESVQQEVEKMRKAGATRQEIRAFVEDSRRKKLLEGHFNQYTKGHTGVNKPKKLFTIPHALDPTLVKEGYNLVVDKNGKEVLPQGLPFQEGYKLIRTTVPVKDHNKRAYAKVFSIMAPIRDALMFNIENTTETKWKNMTVILEKNNIKTKQWLAGPTLRDNYYSSKGIFLHLKENSPDHHPTMKYLEEAELELKSRLFSKDFDFTRPDGVNPYPNPGQGLVE